jgi:hypothetical protein
MICCRLCLVTSFTRNLFGTHWHPSIDQCSSSCNLACHELLCITVQSRLHMTATNDARAVEADRGTTFTTLTMQLVQLRACNFLYTVAKWRNHDQRRSEPDLQRSGAV